MDHDLHCRKCRTLFAKLTYPRNFRFEWVTSIEISDDNAILFVYWTIRCSHEQQNQEFHLNRENKDIRWNCCLLSAFPPTNSQCKLTTHHRHILGMDVMMDDGGGQINFWHEGSYLCKMEVIFCHKREKIPHLTG